jgi:hypothetical protein
MSDFSVKPVLTGAKTILRPFTASDADGMWEIIQDPRSSASPSSPPRS